MGTKAFVSGTKVGEGQDQHQFHRRRSPPVFGDVGPDCNIVTMDETLVSYHTPLTKKQSKQWIPKGQPGPAKVQASRQCFGSGSGLDPDSIWSLDPDPGARKVAKIDIFHC